MNLLTVAAAQCALLEKFEKKAAKFPEHFADLIPRAAPKDQVTEVQDAVRQLTGCECSSDFVALLMQWDFTHLNVANFSFGDQGTFAGRLLEQNRQDAVNAWWEGAFDERPATQLFIAQGDPYVLVLDVCTDAVLAYIADQGAQTAVKIASSLSTCLRMLVTIQMHQVDADGRLTVEGVKNLIGSDCDEQFWDEQVRHWEQFN